MKKLSNLNNLAAEICHREESEGREVNITDTKRVIRHLSDIIAEEWHCSYTLDISGALRKAGMRRIRNNKKPL